MGGTREKWYVLIAVAVCAFILLEWTLVFLFR